VHLLALDTCDPHGSVALLRDAEILSLEAHESAEDYSSWLLSAVDRVLKAGGVALPEVHLYAVATGPGSFTGVRVGLTTVKAWSEVYGRPIAAVSRLRALAEHNSGQASYVAAFTNAQRGQIFGALYRRSGEDLERLEEEMVIAPERFLEWVGGINGNSAVEWLSTEPQCLTQTQEWASGPAANGTVQLVSPVLAPVIGRLGYRLGQTNQLTDALGLDANYVRRSDAEIFWKGVAGHAR
jgi:tRNA threonylcarbamoyladenosine biosynthesis protein TsaB